jgi:hypothetical protein
MQSTKKAREYGESVVLIERSENFSRALLREFLAELQTVRAAAADAAPGGVRGSVADASKGS